MKNPGRHRYKPKKNHTKIKAEPLPTVKEATAQKINCWPKKKTIAWIIGAILVTIMILLEWPLISAIVSYLNDILIQHFGSNTNLILKGALAIGILSTALVYFPISILIKLITPILEKYQSYLPFDIRTKVNFWVKLTIALAIFFLVSGLIIIQTITYGTGLASINIKNTTNIDQIIGVLNCNNNKPYIVNSTQKCTFNQKISNASINLTLTYLNGSETNPISIENSTFIAPDDTYYLLFKVSGTNEKNETINGSSGFNFHFQTKDEYYQNRERFLTYLGALLGLIILTTPYLVLTIRNLWKGKE